MAVDHSKFQNVKASGESIRAFIEGLGSNRAIGLKILAEYGIDNPEAGKWYSIQGILLAYREIERALGAPALFIVGEKIPAYAKFPKHIDNLEEALASIDRAYLMNHALDGKPFYDEQTGEALAGIGHYKFVKTSNNTARIICDNPYPTYFDEGIIYAVAQRFHENCYVRLDEVKSSRQKGGNADEFIVQWF